MTIQGYYPYTTSQCSHNEYSEQRKSNARRCCFCQGGIFLPDIWLIDKRIFSDSEIIPSDNQLFSSIVNCIFNMADADEEIIQNPDASTQPEVDLSDETQDFRFLNNLNM
jgi:hypothetical protein